MGCPSEVKLGSTLTFSIDTHNPQTSAAIDADALPTYRVYEAETQTPIATGTMAKLDDPGTLGFYSASLSCTAANGYEDGKSYSIYIAAIVAAITGTISYGFKVAGEVDVSPAGGLPSEAAICNLALIQLGDDPITSLGDDSDRARLCNRLYGQSRNELIDWVRPNFAKKRVALARLAAAPASGYTYQYQLPSDCLRALATDDEYYTWSIEGRALLTNANTVVLSYLAIITDTASFSPKFTLALVAYLRALMAYPVTKSASMAQLMGKMYEASLAEAIASEGAEGTPVTMQSSVLTTSARVGGGENPERSWS